jgi:diadenosine tetraphosphate (Ap4A) HIT family hydrolase
MRKKLLSRNEYDEWIEGIPKGACTFCQWQEYQIPLKEFDNWVWIANIAPYWHWHTMIFPKRHFVRLEEMNLEETGELMKALKYAEDKYRQANLRTKDGQLIKNYVYFWRFRTRDRVGNERKCAHFHLHFAPQIEHSWDPTLEKDAHLCDVVGKLK